MLRILPARRPQALLAVPVFAPTSLKTIINRFSYARCPPQGSNPARLKKAPATKVASAFLVAELGFEPRHTESESAVLPLHNSAIICCPQRLLV